LHVAVGLSLNLLLLPKASGHTLASALPQDECARVSATMIVLAAVFGATWFVSVALAAHLPRLLQAIGVAPAAAVAAAALVGAAQVAARLAEFGLLRRASPLTAARIAACLHPVGAALLATIGSPAPTMATGRWSPFSLRC
jgi:hypothetical protein